MRRFLAIALAVLAVLAVVAAGAWTWLTAKEPVPQESDYVLSIEELRRLADAVPGAKPVAVYSALVAEASLPRAAVFAGESFDPHPMVHQVFQIAYPDGGSVVLDAGFPASFLERMDPNGRHHAAAYEQVHAALSQADQAFVTHEHFDHLAGIADHPAPEALAGRVRLTSEQLANEEALGEARVPDALRERLEPLAFERVHAAAPGIVLQKAPGHTPGTLLAYVRLQDGSEYLFVGDVAWHLDQIAHEHYRPRLVTSFFLGEDRRAVLAQFRAIANLMRETPDLAVVVSHDADQRHRLLEAGRLRDGTRAP